MSTDHEIKATLEQPYDRMRWTGILRRVFGATRLSAIPQPIPLPGDAGKASAVELGSMDTQDGWLMGFYEVQMEAGRNVERTRTGLREMLRQIYQHAVDGAIVVFVQGSKWRCSYISEIRQRNPLTQEFESKATEPRRFSYLFGTGEVCRTAAERFAALEGKPLRLGDVYEAFSVEKLNREFFDAYRGHYEKFWRFLAGNAQYREWLVDAQAADDARKEKPLRDFVKLLLGRIVFLHFLQKKGWMGVPADRDDWQGGEPDFLRRLFQQFPVQAQFLSSALHALFFQTLNTRREGDLMPASLGSGRKAPYLNGGLFDRTPGDRHPIDFPADYFHDLFVFFSHYNFTIDENDPFEAEVGIDPEMLGRIFENLLEENREKGTFYTPKEIVHYMCQESLIQYLRSHLAECAEDHAPATREVEDLIRHGRKADRNLEPRSFVVRRAKDIERLLDSVKVCDPAIGSGAFPMGLLREILRAKMSLDYTLDPAEVKKNIIQNSIYGVDIERGAVDIARLRFWLALVVDEEAPQPLPNLDYKIMQGNSLLEQFEGIDLSKTALFGGQLKVPGDQQFNVFTGKTNAAASERGFSAQVQADIKKLVHEYFDVSDRLRKEEIHAAIDRIVLEHIEFSLKAFERKFLEQLTAQAAKVNAKMSRLTADQRKVFESSSKDHKELLRLGTEFALKEEALRKLQELEQAPERPYFLWHLFFKDVFDQGGFDIVIMNPPYLQLSKLKDKALQEANFATYTKNGDLYCLFYELGLNHLKQGGILCAITSNSWLQTQYGEALRNFWVERANPKLLLNLSGHQIFETAIVETNILVVQRGEWKRGLKVAVLDENYSKGMSISMFLERHGYPLKDLDRAGWVIGGTAGQAIMGKMKLAGKKLGEWNVEIYRGITTGLNEAYVIDQDTHDRLVAEDPRSAEILKPTLRGRDLKRYESSESVHYLIFTRRGIDIERFPAVLEHLSQFKERLTPKPKGWIGDWKGRKPGSYKWYELQDSVDYFEEFDKPKIIWGELSDEAKFTYDDGGHYLNNTIFMMTGEHLLFLLGVLNSVAAQWAFERISTTSGMGTNRWLKYKVETLPVPEPSSETIAPIELLVKRILQGKAEGSDTRKWERKVDALVFQQYGLSEEEMDHVLESLSSLSTLDRAQIRNEYRRIALHQFDLEL